MFHHSMCCSFIRPSHLLGCNRKGQKRPSHQATTVEQFWFSLSNFREDWATLFITVMHCWCIEVSYLSTNRCHTLRCTEATRQLKFLMTCSLLFLGRRPAGLPYKLSPYKVIFVHSVNTVTRPVKQGEKVATLSSCYSTLCTVHVFVTCHMQCCVP